MLLLKREERLIKKHMSDDEMNKRILEGYIDKQKTEDRYLLDDKNAIILVKNNDKTSHSETYIMIHERLIDGRIKEINRWYMSGYYFGSIHYVTPISNLNLFKIQNGAGSFNALYDYQNGKFVVPRGDWDLLEFGRRNKLLEQYNGILASFSLSSDYEEDDELSYVNPVTNEKVVESFGVRDGNYYALLNLDGTIRGNRLFKGENFSKIESIIDLDKYESLAEFKKERKQFCNDKKKKQKQEYYQMIEARNDGSISPYLDSEVAKILELKINKI